MTAPKIVKKIVEAPAVALENATNVLDQPAMRKTREFWRLLGPGLTTGAADDDPSGIGTYSQTGAQQGLGLLWLAAYSFPFMAIVQEMCARIAMVTGRGLAANIKRHFPPAILAIATIGLALANVFNIGADLGAMASATQLLLPSLPFSLLVIVFAAISMMLQIYIPYARYAQYLKWLTLVLFSYILSTFTMDIQWKEVLVQGFLPSFNGTREQLMLVTAVLGTTLSPYLFFWQTGQEIEEEINQGRTTVELRKGASKEEVRRMRIDVWFGMFISNLVMFFIITAGAATLFTAGITDINTATDAAKALEPLAGRNATLLFAIGIIGTGMLAVPILAGSLSYALSETFGWRFGLARTLRQARAFYGVIIIAIVLGLGMNFVRLNPMKALLYSAVANGIVAPLILALILGLSSSRTVMGDWANRPLTTALGAVITIIMIITALITLSTLLV